MIITLAERDEIFKRANQILGMSWAITASATTAAVSMDPPFPRGEVMRRFFPCVWCGEEYKPGIGGDYCSCCYGPREDGIRG